MKKTEREIYGFVMNRSEEAKVRRLRQRATSRESGELDAKIEAYEEVLRFIGERNPEPSKGEGLEALKRIRQETAPNTICGDFDKEECCDIIERELKDGEKHKKALEIIKSKGIDLDEFGYHRKACTYNAHTKSGRCEDLTDEEFDLLKEVLK